ncbi:MAG: hypothetical protein JXA93_23735 [Anaerolineae bacterium]|nr:hypothetical protein [Anaerolineae bacterium]
MTDTRRSVVLVRSLDHYQRLRQEHLAALTDGTVVGLATHLSLAAAIRQDQVRFLHYTDLMTAQDYEEAVQDAFRLSLTWFTDIAGPIAPVDLLESIRLEILQSLGEIFVAQRAITRLVEELAPEHLLLVGERQGKVEAVVAYEAEKRGIAVTIVAEAAPGNTGRLRRRASTLLRQIVHNALATVAFRARQLVQRKPVLLAFGSGVDSVNQQRLAPAIEQVGDVRVLLVRTAEANEAAFNRPGELKHPFLFFVPLNRMLHSEHYLPRCRAWLHAFRQGQASYRGPYPFLYSNRHLDPFFENICLHLFSHALAIKKDLQGMLRHSRPQIVLTNSEVSFPNRMLVLEAKSRELLTLGIIHSGLNQMHYRDFQSDLMAVWGQVHLQDFARVLHKPASQIKPLGNPQYDTFTCDQDAGTRHANATVALPPRVLVITAVPHWHMSYTNLRYQELAWQELARLPESGIQLIVKPHPRFDDLAFYRSLPHQLPDWQEHRPGISVAASTFLEHVVPTCDLVVVPGSPTTGAVEAMLCCKPVVYLRGGETESAFSTPLAPGCLVVEEVQDIRPTILALCRRPDLRAELMQQGQTYLDALLGPRDGHAIERLAGLINSLMEQRH